MFLSEIVGGWVFKHMLILEGRASVRICADDPLSISSILQENCQQQRVKIFEDKISNADANDTLKEYGQDNYGDDFAYQDLADSNLQIQEYDKN